MIEKNNHTNQLPEDWKWVKLGEECEVITGTTPSKADSSNYGNDIPFFKPPHLWDGLIYDTDEKLSLKGGTKARVVPPNTVLVTCIGNLGRTGLVKRTAAFNQQINAILENEKVDSKYLFYQAQSPLFKKQLEKLATGTTVSIVNKGNFETINIPLPPKPTQLAIVSKIEELFSEIENGIKSLFTAKEQLKKYRQSVLKRAFEGKLSESGFTRLKDEQDSVNKKILQSSNSENPDSDKGELPEGWKLVKLGDVIEKPKYGTSKKCDYATNGIGVLRIPNIVKGMVDSSDLKFAQFDAQEIETYGLKEGDILTIRSNGSVDIVGKCALIRKMDEQFLYAGYLIRLRAIQKLLLPKYLANILSSVNIRNQIEEKAKSTSGVNNINSQELAGLIIPLPSIQEQHKIIEAIESCLSVADKMEESITKSLQQAAALKQSILKKAFEGRLV